MATATERFQAKWKPVRVEKTRQIKNLEPRFDSIETGKALAVGRQNRAILNRCNLLLTVRLVLFD